MIDKKVEGEKNKKITKKELETFEQEVKHLEIISKNLFVEKKINIPS